MASWDPLVTGLAKLPDKLIPKPSPRAAAGAAPAPAAQPTGGGSSGSSASGSCKPKSLSTVLGTVHGICAAAQSAAFPGVNANVQVVVTDKAGADYQNNSAMALFALLKASGLPEGIKSPRDTADRLAEQMKVHDANGIIAKLEVAGPGFINIFLSVDWLSKRVLSFVTDGVLPPPCTPLRAVVDFSSPNVAKEMHVGHLRSTIIGDCLCRVLEFVGHDVDRVNHIGDWGTQFGMLIRHLKNVFPDFATKPPPIADLTQFYKESKKVFDEDEVFAKHAHEEVVALQQGDGQSRYAWGQICDVSRKEFEKVYSRLGVVLHEKGESYYNEYIPAVVAHLEEIGLAKEVSRHTAASAHHGGHCAPRRPQPPPSPPRALPPAPSWPCTPLHAPARRPARRALRDTLGMMQSACPFSRACPRHPRGDDAFRNAPHAVDHTAL